MATLLDKLVQQIDLRPELEVLKDDDGAIAATENLAKLQVGSRKVTKGGMIFYLKAG